MNSFNPFDGISSIPKSRPVNEVTGEICQAKSVDRDVSFDDFFANPTQSFSTHQDFYGSIDSIVPQKSIDPNLVISTAIENSAIKEAKMALFAEREDFEIMEAFRCAAPTVKYEDIEPVATEVYVEGAGKEITPDQYWEASIYNKYKSNSNSNKEENISNFSNENSVKNNINNEDLFERVKNLEQKNILLESEIFKIKENLSTLIMSNFSFNSKSNVNVAEKPKNLKEILKKTKK